MQCPLLLVGCSGPAPTNVHEPLLYARQVLGPGGQGKQQVGNEPSLVLVKDGSRDNSQTSAVLQSHKDDVPHGTHRNSYRMLSRGLPKASLRLESEDQGLGERAMETAV